MPIKEQVDALLNQLYALSESSQDSEQVRILEQQIDTMILRWQGKIERLGGTTTGLWLARFDSGDGYYCWHFPEDRIYSWHRYDQAYPARVSIKERAQQKSNRCPTDISY